MTFHEHRLQIRVILDDQEEQKLQELTRKNIEEMGTEISADLMLQRLIEQAITEKLA